MRAQAFTAVVAFALGAAAAILLSGGVAGGRRGAARAPGAPPDTVAWEERYRESERRNEELAARVAALERNDTAHAPDAPAPAPEPAEGRSPRPPRFVVPGAEKGLEAVDWRAAGESVAKLMPLLSEASDVMHGRREMRAALWGDILQTSGPIITEAVKLEEAGVPWSSPSFLANLVHATLREAGSPLDARQEEALEAIAHRHAQEEAQRRSGYGDGTPRLRQVIEDARAQDRFFAEVSPLLGDAQRGVLYPPGVRGVTGLDLFSGASVWDERLERLKHGDRAALRTAAAAAHARDLGLRDELRAQLDAIVAEWERSLPDAFVLHEADAAAAAEVEMEPYARVMFSADRQLALHEALLLRMPLLDEERARILAREEVLVPFLSK